MWKVLERWVDRYFADEEAVLLSLFLVVAVVVMVTMGQILAPLLAAVIIAFLLQGAVNRLDRLRVPHLASVSMIFICFMSLLLAAIFVLVPLVIRQSTNLLAEVPRMIKQLQQAVQLLPDKYPHLISEQDLQQLMTYSSKEVAKFGEAVLSFSFSNFPNLIALLVYVVLVPILVFFLMKDRELLLDSFGRLLPNKRPVMMQIWLEMNDQMANYVRGKVVEIMIVGSSAYISFVLLGVNYAALLGLLVGLSVVIPYIGAVVVTIPVMMVGYFQWGWSGDFFWLCGIYGVIQFLDGNVLVPLLFSEAVNLHPIAIIMAVLVFGGLWGFWGVFFAIPLATLIKAMYNAWPRRASTVIHSEELTRTSQT